MVEQLVKQETWQLAKDKGFSNKKIVSLYGGSEIVETCKEVIPTQSLIQAYLRNKYKLHINIHPHFDNWNELSAWEFTSITNLIESDNQVNRSLFDTYEEALEYGLWEGLKLIK